VAIDFALAIEPLAALASLTLLEIVLGIDNILFIALLTGRLPPEQQAKARLIGLSLAMIMRIGLLYSLFLIMSLTAPWITLFGHSLSGRDLILLAGGGFLVYKSVQEIHERLEGAEHVMQTASSVKAQMRSILVQIVFLDIVFSLDSVITAIGMSDQIWVMATAIVIAVIFMMVFSKWVSDFIHKHPTVKMLALSFLLLIGFVLVADGFGHHIPKGYIYSAIGFSLFVEFLNIRLRAKSTPVNLHNSLEETAVLTKHP
jgi:predicted tellurium resistance membrane protein TerC